MDLNKCITDPSKMDTVFVINCNFNPTENLRTISDELLKEYFNLQISIIQYHDHLTNSTFYTLIKDFDTDIHLIHDCELINRDDLLLHANLSNCMNQLKWRNDSNKLALLMHDANVKPLCIALNIEEKQSSNSSNGFVADSREKRITKRRSVYSFSDCLKEELQLNKQEMPVSKEHLVEKLQRELEAEYLNVEDFSEGCGAKFSVFVVSKKFEGKSLLQRQRLVNEILEEEMKEIHALTQKTLTPEQWAKMSDSAKEQNQQVDQQKCIK